VAHLKSQHSIIQSERNILLKLEYCGTNFAGWQQQANDRTVQGVLKENLEKFLRHKVKITGSGRTDAGVHALAQHANFVTSSAMKSADIKHRLNRMLPPDVVVLDCHDVPWSFDSRRQALWRSYRYLICERLSAINKDFAWVIERRLDLDLLNELAGKISISTHFENFCKTKSLKESNECQIFRTVWTRHAGLLRFDIVANRFLHNMVRLLVGTMVAVCDDRLSADHFEKLLNGKIKEKSKYISPACGLYLAEVGYERGRL
jgi:tRNA pseudouridine38-40 synthase